MINPTAFGTVETAVEAMKAGAYDYLTKPAYAEQMSLVVGQALEHCRLVREVRVLRSTLDRKYGFENILGHSEALLRALDTAARAAYTSSTVLIRGETGTGKEVLAKAIHCSPGKDKPLVPGGPCPLRCRLHGVTTASFCRTPGRPRIRPPGLSGRTRRARRSSVCRRLSSAVRSAAMLPRPVGSRETPPHRCCQCIEDP
jgi:hypothetical protein